MQHKTRGRRGSTHPTLKTTASAEKQSWTWEELDEKILLNSRMASSKMVGFLYFSYLIQFNLFASENAISEKMRKKCTKNLQVNWDIMQDDVISFNGFPFCKCRKIAKIWLLNAQFLRIAIDLRSPPHVNRGHILYIRFFSNIY